MELIDVELVADAAPARLRAADCLIVGLLLWILADVQHDPEHWRYAHDVYTGTGFVFFLVGLVKNWRE